MKMTYYEEYLIKEIMDEASFYGNDDYVEDHLSVDDCLLKYHHDEVEHVGECLMEETPYHNFVDSCHGSKIIPMGENVEDKEHCWLPYDEDHSHGVKKNEECSMEEAYNVCIKEEIWDNDPRDIIDEDEMKAINFMLKGEDHL